MTADHQYARLAAEITRTLPLPDVERLARAVEGGARTLTELRSTAGSPALRWSCEELLRVGPSAALAGSLRGAAAVRAEASPSVDVVWGGPDSPGGGGRLTSAVITECLDGASESILIVGYAVHDEPSVLAALHRAADRQIPLTLLCERPADNPRFDGPALPFPSLAARRLAWPAERRPAGACLHAKLLVVDRHIALVGSANLTGAALSRNLECGVLISGGPLPAAVLAHINGLVAAGVLRPV